MSVQFTGRWVSADPAAACPKCPHLMGTHGPRGCPQCEDCWEDGETWTSAVDMNQRNGVDLLTMMGLAPAPDAQEEMKDPEHWFADPYGELDAAAFLEAIALARLDPDVRAADAGLPYHAETNDLGELRSATWRQPGLFAYRLRELEVIARQAAGHNGKVVWG